MKQFLQDLAKATKWSEKSFNYLPWRTQRSFYHTLISEVMLQQTTVTTVMNRFDKFIEVFPDFASLANGNENELLRLWQGLGYYNRARRLQMAAKILTSENMEELNVEKLLKIPGVGNYTANALMAIGLNKSAFAIDVNLERVLIRYFGQQNKLKKLHNVREALQEWLNSKLSKQVRDFRNFHETLMDVGRVFCQARSRNCIQCPLKKGCKSFRQNRDLHLDVKPKVLKSKLKSKDTKKNEIELARIVAIKDEQILLVQRKKGQWLSGQWEVPTFVLKGDIPSFQYSKNELDIGEPKLKIKTTITKYNFDNHIYLLANTKVTSIKDVQWFKMSKISKMPITSVTHKILEWIKSS